MGKKQLELFSPLFCRVNGAMLGFFLFASIFKFAAKVYPFYRSRMQQFLDETESGIKLPKSQLTFIKNFSALEGSILEVLMQKHKEGAPDLLTSFLLGYEFCRLKISGDDPEKGRAAILREILENFRLDPSLIEKYGAEVKLDSGRVNANDLMTPALGLLRETILPLDVEPDTCFVAMPFSEPFESYYSTIYRPLLEKHGVRAIRAWGGVANEVHTHMMFTLIDKSEWFLAELTGTNLNVVLELGYAWGRDKKVLSIIDVSKSKHFANLRDHMSIPYDSSAEGWVDDVLNGAGKNLMKACVMVLSGWSEGDEVPP